jgi:hypothetical protein
MCMSVIVDRFIDHLLIANSSVIDSSHTQQFTTARTKFSQSAVITSRCLVAASNGGRSPSSEFSNYPRALATSF